MESYIAWTEFATNPSEIGEGLIINHNYLLQVPSINQKVHAQQEQPPDSLVY